jgi:hypothetical protein
MTRQFFLTAIALALTAMPLQICAGSDIPLRHVSRAQASDADQAEAVATPDAVDQADAPCDDQCSCDPGYSLSCCTPRCRRAPVWQAFGEYLYLRPGNEKVAYAVPFNGAVTAPTGFPVQLGNEAVADDGFDSGFRVGVARDLGGCNSIGVTYSDFNSRIDDAVTIHAPIALTSLVAHPGTQDASTNFLHASAGLKTDFQLADVAYRQIFSCNECYSVNYVLGFRYGSLQQGFGSTFTNSTTVATVNTNVNFEGAGISLGLEGERHLPCCSGMLIYAKGLASFLGGIERTGYQQANNFAGTVVDTGWKEDRIVPVLDLELGAGWTSPNGRVRATAGYLVSAWMNTINSDEFIHAVQNNASSQENGLTHSVTFDGFTARVEYHF